MSPVFYGVGHIVAITYFNSLNLKMCVRQLDVETLYD